MLALSHAQPLAIGHRRAVYQHPERDDLLIKTLRLEAMARRRGLLPHSGNFCRACCATT